VEPGCTTNCSVYLTGYTTSTNFPQVNALPFPNDHLQGAVDAFVTKLGADGATLLYSTYLGGSDEDYAGGIAVEGQGQAYVTGITYSSDFPRRNAAINARPGLYNPFLTKLSATGTLLYSTYLGGSGSGYSCGDPYYDPCWVEVGDVGYAIA